MQKIQDEQNAKNLNKDGMGVTELPLCPGLQQGRAGC